MAERQITKLLNELRTGLKKIYAERLSGIYLFGSYVRGEPDDESDLDVAIVLEDFYDYWEEIQRTSRLISQLSLHYGISISPVRVRKAQWFEDDPFLNNVRKEALPI
ncbi:nucleotidyltransferase domain-containing protein [Acidobacteria bacterium AH-259-L09]|nr:nucleotidyltransferase domain-containing protein [Acidobacteria bacterium AH-259-L09]